MTTTTFAKATLFTRHEMFGNIIKLEVKDLVIETGVKYAQYDNAVKVTFVPKGKRSRRGMMLTYKPDLIVLEGWGHSIEPDGFMNPVGIVEGPVTVTRSRYSSHDAGWQRDFEAKLNKYLAEKGLTIAADFRGHNSHERF